MFMRLLAIAFAIIGWCSVAIAQDDPVRTLFTNVHVFDGISAKRIENANVLIEGNLIKSVSTDPIDAAGATVIDGGGRTLMPGLIDAHVHLSLNMGFLTMYNQAPDYIAARTLAEAKNTLLRGFTSVRDTGGQVLGAKKAIDEGYHIGPRIWASGAGISMTAGHADLRPPTQRPRQLGGPAWTEGEYNGGVVIADGVPEVLSAARMQMRNGSAFLKMFTSGAVSGMYDPLDIGEYSFDEIKAAADEAKRWNTYLAVHTYNDKGSRLALEAGAMSIEHASLMTEETMKLLVKKGAFLSTQTGVFLSDPPAGWSEGSKARQRQAKEGLDNMFKLAKKYGAKITIGSDYVDNGEQKKEQSLELSNRLTWFEPAEILAQATSGNAEILYFSGPRNPYPGKLGVIEEGAFADILLVEGNPVEDLTLFHNPEENLPLIMKDGVIYKNTLQ
jgi:imidazolonepropionase-like amidohydrolase